MNYYLGAIKKYATFSGRARRAEYWMFTLVNALIGISLTVLSYFAPAIDILSVIYSLALFIPGLALSARRLHDIDKSGWLMLIALIPIIGAIVLLVWDCTEGTKGDNRFGADPKAVEFATAEN